METSLFAWTDILRKIVLSTLLASGNIASCILSMINFEINMLFLLLHYKSQVVTKTPIENELLHIIIITVTSQV